MSIKALVPYLRVRNGLAAIEFYEKAFGAELVYKLDEPGGGVGHAELRLDGHRFMLSDEYPHHGIVGPATLGGTGSGLSLDVDDCDAVAARAVAAGATLVRPPEDQFYGHRTAMVRDPFGHEWMIGQDIGLVSEAEAQQKYNDIVAGR